MTCPEIQSIVTSIKEHYLIWGVAAGYLYSAMVNNLPVPGTPFKLYDYIYGVLHSLNSIPAMQKFEQKGLK